MKKVLLLSAVAIFALSFASCKKCKDCKCEDEPSEEVCEDDFDSKSEYDAVIALAEAFGCECK